MIEGHGALVGEEDVPFGELRGVFGRAVSYFEEGFGHDGWQGAAGDGHSEDAMTVQGMVLAAEDVGPELLGEGVGIRETVELGSGTSHGDGSIELGVNR